MHRRGRNLAVDALAGETGSELPVGLFTWGFDYLWKVAGLEPWQLACGSHETWHRAHLALLDRHAPDVIWYSGAGMGDLEPSLAGEDRAEWHVESNGGRFRVHKDSYALVNDQTGQKGCDAVGEIRTPDDADRLIGEFTGWGEAYLAGLARLIEEVGDRALVLPHHSPAYICACYALGFERAMEAMLTEPELFAHVCERYAAGDALRMRQWARAGAEACFIADGWASCDIISPQMFDHFALPCQQSITRAAHEAGLRIILWNEGDILPILDREAALEVDAFAFEQPRKGANVTVAGVRQTFGADRCLLGNLDSERLLLRNDPREIAEAVDRQVAESGTGPFILSTGSPLPSNVEPAAVDAMIARARQLPPRTE